MRKITFLLAILIAPLLSHGQDTIWARDHPRFTIKNAMSTMGTAIKLIRNTSRINITHKCLVSYNWNFFDALLNCTENLEKYRVNYSDSFSFPVAVRLQNLEGIGLPIQESTRKLPNEGDKTFYEIPEMLSISNIKANSILLFQNIDITGLASVLTFDSLKVPGIGLSSVRTKNLNISNVNAGIEMNNCNIGQTTFKDIFADKNTKVKDISIRNSRISGLDFQSCPSMTIHLNNDSLLGVVSVSDTKTNLPSSRWEITDTYLDAPIHGGQLNAKNIVFDRVKFGPNTDLIIIACDTIIFKNCGLLPNSLKLEFLQNKNVYLHIQNTDFSDVRFTYNSFTQLIFQERAEVYSFDMGYQDPDIVSSTYQSLLEKFKKEGQVNSYQLIDIEYRQWQAHQSSLFFKVGNFINEIWWYYGYKKWLILFWSVVFLFAFTWYNYRHWKGVNSSYPVIPQGTSNEHKLSNVLVHTFLVFFSLKIDFDKLSYFNRKYVYVFFLQYIVGLICIFFIFNAILKLG